MAPALRPLLLGRDSSRFQRALEFLLAIGLLVATFAAYAVGLFQVACCVIVLPADATLVGFVAAAGIGFRRGGLLVAWLLPFAAYLGFRADWAFLSLSSHSFEGQLDYFFDPVGLAVLGVAAVLVGTLGFAAGRLLQWSLGALRRYGAQGSEQD